MNGALLELPRTPYREAWELQRALVAKRRAEEIGDTLVLVEHPPIYTVGRSGTSAHVLYDDATRARLGIDLLEVDRGGDATYHGPGQAVGYPIVDLRPRAGDVHAYLRELEALLLAVLADYGLTGERDGRYTGVWVGGRKVAAIGVKVSGGITSHGFALNVDTDPVHWAGIVPCGIGDRGVTTLHELLGAAPPLEEVRARIVRHSGDLIGRAASLAASGGSR